MKRGRILFVAAPLLAAVLLTSCGEPVSDEHVRTEPYSVAETDDEGVASVTLTESAAERLGIKTALVESRGTSLVVPSDAIYLVADGTFWVYTVPEPLVFIRNEVSIIDEEGGRAFLSDGPPPGTEVVTVGVPELYGSETGFGT